MESAYGQLDVLRIAHAAGRYETVAAEEAAMQRPYKALAELLNCRPENIAIVTSATVGWQQVSCRHRPPAHLSLETVQQRAI